MTLSVKTAKAKILLIEAKRADRPSFAFGLDKKGYQVTSVPNGATALEQLANGLPDLVIVDAASMRTSGRRICHSLQKQAPGVPVVLILTSEDEQNEKNNAKVVLTLPFTLQKLINRIRPLLPVEEKNVLKAGPFQLDVQQRIARRHDRQTRLTPRLVSLLKLLMEHPGEVIARDDLFREVWDTAFTGDTRTLDVHVSWLRQALEDDPRRPAYIKTVRGQGYRLDIEPVNGSETAL